MSELSSMHEFNSGGGVKSIRQWNQLLGSLVTIIKYNKRTIYHSIYIKVFSDGKVSYLMLYTDDDVLNTTNNDTEFNELRRFSEEAFSIKFQ